LGWPGLKAVDQNLDRFPIGSVADQRTGNSCLDGTTGILEQSTGFRKMHFGTAYYQSRSGYAALDGALGGEGGNQRRLRLAVADRHLGKGLDDFLDYPFVGSKGCIGQKNLRCSRRATVGD